MTGQRAGRASTLSTVNHQLLNDSIRMTYLIKIVSSEVDGFLRTVRAQSEATFLELCQAILHSCHWPDDQMTSFYVCDREWRRHQQITRFPVGEDDADDLLPMESTRLSDFVADTGQRFDFVFDPFADRHLSLQVKEIIPGGQLQDGDSVEVQRSEGRAPRQIEMPDFSTTSQAGVADADDEDDGGAGYLGSGLYNADELDLDGFEVTDNF